MSNLHSVFIRHSLCLSVFVMLLSCGKKDSESLPVAMGDPYHVVLMAADSAAAQPMVDLLTAEMSGLPQPEPTFDVRIVSPEQLETPACRYARTLVRIDIDDSKYSSADVGYKNDRWARGQLVLNITAPSVKLLSQMVWRNARKLVELLVDHEMDSAKQQLARRHNQKAEAMVRQMFGIDMLIPPTLTSMKTGKDFIWLSDNRSSRRQNICIYTVPRQLTEGDMQYRDSVMRVNIKGETDSMYMQTVTDGLRRQSIGHGQTFTRGLWEMKGDGMGGPFVERTVFLRHYTLVAEGFVYAPESKKRNLVRELEATLKTIKIYQ